jgi:spectinomycin phosphotransferase
MRAAPEDVETSALIDALADGWGLEVESADYAAVGAGSYHWIVCDVEGVRAFATVDDLERKPWLGDTRESAFEGLARALEAAVAARDSGLEFVVAPIRSARGETLRRLDPRHTVALFPFVDGRAGHWDFDSADERAAVVRLFAELHRAASAVRSAPRTVELDVPGRGRLEAALRDVDRAWSSGPFAEPARKALAAHASDVVELLALADRLAAGVERGGWVLTHGEPHAGNVMFTGRGPMLIDWDTVALGPPERDLWLLVGGGGEEGAIYADATGHRIDDRAVSFFRLAWDLADLAAYLEELRAPHRESVDTVQAYDRVLQCVAIRGSWAELLD